MRFLLFLIIGSSFLILPESLLASPKSDSINTFTGAARSKFVWRRWAWCNDDYTPKTGVANDNSKNNSIMLYDTKEGAERTLTAGANGVNGLRISRSGKWAIWLETDKTSSYIINLESVGATKTVLLQKSNCTYWAARAFYIDPVNGTEYLFCLDNATHPTGSSGNGIYKVKLNADGTADKATATKLTIKYSGSIDENFGVSGDGNKLGGAFPWPNTQILDIPSGNLTGRHHSGSAFGCQPNIAPDNSYRFFHCEDDHLGIYMFPPLSTAGADWLITLNANLAEITSGTTMDFDTPRWTNHVQFYVSTYPMGDNAESYCGLVCEMTGLWGQSATWVKNSINMKMVPKVFVGKFSADFKTQEKSMLVASDARYFQYGIDGWLCNGTTYGNPCAGISVAPNKVTQNVAAQRFSIKGTEISIAPFGLESSTIIIADSKGRTVQLARGKGINTINTRTLKSGAYIVYVKFLHQSASLPLIIPSAR